MSNQNTTPKSPRPASLHPETIALHAGWRADPTTGSVAVPIHQTTSFQFRDTAHAENLFALKELGYLYTRVTNPTVDVLEQRLAALEGGAAALALASGQAASALSVQNLARVGDNIVASTDLYGGTWSLFANTLAEQGIEVRFVDPADPENFRRATDDRTRAYYGETLANPKLAVFPIAEVAEIGRGFGIPLIVDNTAAPLLARPFDHGRGDRSLFHHQVSRRPRHRHRRRHHRWRSVRLGGQPPAPAGPQHPRSELSRRGLDGGGQAPRAHRLYPARPGPAATRPRPVRLAAQCLPHPAGAGDRGPAHRAPQPQRAGRGRLPRRPARDRAGHPSLARHRQGARAGGTILQGRLWRPRRVRARCRARGRPALHRSPVAVLPRGNIGDARSLAIHPASTTHSQLSPADRRATGVSDGYVRLSIGLEHIDDILADLDQALASVGSFAKAA